MGFFLNAPQCDAGMESVFYGMIKLNTMTNEEIYENVMGHKPNKEFGLKGSFSWDDIDALMTAVKNCSIPAVVGRSEQLNCDHEWKVEAFDCYGMPYEQYCEHCGKKEAI